MSALKEEYTMTQRLPKWHKCKICLYISTSTSWMVNHLWQHTSSLFKKALFSCHENIDKYKCYKCHFESHMKVKFDKHSEVFRQLKQQHLSSFYVCEGCHFATYSFMVLLIHLHEKKCLKGIESDFKNEVNKRNKEESKGLKEKWFKCDKCLYTSKFKKGIKQHVRLEVGMKRYRCRLCFYTSKYRNGLRVHVIKNHEKMKRFFTCKYCSYKSKYKISFRVHERMQHFKPIAVKEEWFSYDIPLKPERTICLNDEEILRNEGNLRKIADFDGYRNVIWYGCPSCTYRSKKKCTIKTHILYKHTTPIVCYTCDICPYKSRTKVNLMRHRQVKHGPNKKSCVGCISKEIF